MWIQRWFISLEGSSQGNLLLDSVSLLKNWPILVSFSSCCSSFAVQSNNLQVCLFITFPVTEPKLGSLMPPLNQHRPPQPVSAEPDPAALPALAVATNRAFRVPLISLRWQRPGWRGWWVHAPMEWNVDKGHHRSATRSALGG